MSILGKEGVIAAEYARARDFYSPVEPTYQAQLTLGQEDARILPINLTDMYRLMSEQIDMNPDIARSYARTFGATRVLLALDNTRTNFKFTKYGSQPKATAEISTQAQCQLGDIVCAEEIDCPITYILTDSGNLQTVEMSLVQAMHMVDTAMATRLCDTATSLVRKADIDTLLELKAKCPEILLRTYGNVRRLSGVPTVLGTVIQTSLLERSGVETDALSLPGSPEKLSKEAVSRERIRASFVGVTTAKPPHIGHGLLLAKAIADSPNGKVLVELNDQGPRVEQMISTLASDRGLTIDEAITAVSTGVIPLDEIETSYKNRKGAPTLAPGSRYGLEPCNTYYRELLGKLGVPGTEILTLANSEMGDLEDGVRNSAGYEQLFSGVGMDILRDQGGNAMVTRSAGKTTLQGMMAQLAFGYDLKLVDSPPALTKQELSILEDNGIGLESGMGCGLLLDFSSASGTNGRSISLESLFRTGLPQGALIAAIRKVMDGSTFFVSETGSLCPNFSDNKIFLQRLEKELAVLDEGQITNIVRRPIQYIDVRKRLVTELLQSVYQTFPVEGKVKAGEICKLLDLFPILAKRLPGKVIARAANLASDLSLPKNLLTAESQKLLQSIRRLDAQVLCVLLRSSCEDEGMYLSNYLQNTELQDIISQMGYIGGSTMNAVEKVLTARGVFKIL